MLLYASASAAASAPSLTNQRIRFPSPFSAVAALLLLPPNSSEPAAGREDEPTPTGGGGPSGDDVEASCANGSSLALLVVPTRSDFSPRIRYQR